MSIRPLPRAFVLVVFAGAIGSLLLSGCGRSASSGVEPDSTRSGPATTVAQSSSAEDVPSSSKTADTSPKDPRSVADKLSDAVVETRVKKALMRQDELRVFSFRPTVVGGRLLLRGDVNTPEQYRRAERVVERVEGVTHVRNQMTMGGRPVTEARLNGDDDRKGADEAVYHTVRPGDTLWDIARKYQAPIEQIRSLNNLRSESLRPGERIRVR